MTLLYTPDVPFQAIPAGLLEACARLGVAVTQDPDAAGITHVLPVRDEDALHCVNLAASRGIPFVSKTAYQLSFDKVDQQMLTDLYGVPTLKTLVPRSAQQVLDFTTGPVIMKLRRSFNEGVARPPFSYKVYPNPAALAPEIDEDFWLMQASDDPTRQFVIQEAITEQGRVPLRTINFVVNGKSECLFSRNVITYFATDGDYMDRVDGAPDHADMEGTLEQIRAVVRALKIRNAAMNAQFIRHNGVDYLIDWNQRPGMAFFYLTPVDLPALFDTYMAHMLDLPYTPVPLEGYLLIRVYRRPTDVVAPLAAALGLSVLRATGRLNLDAIAWVYGRGDKAELEARFAQLETQL